MPRPLELKPVILREAKAPCGCSFAVIRQQMFTGDDASAEVGWAQGDSLVVVPCVAGDHLEAMRDLLEPFVAERVDSPDWPPSQDDLDGLAAELGKRVGADA